MKFPQSLIERILDYHRISSVVGKYVNLRKSGHNFSGLCPFHPEKTPSFTVSDEKGFYYCFGCRAKGNAIKFLMEYERMSYPEVVEKLAAEAGIKIERDNSFEARTKAGDEKALFAVLEEASRFFESTLSTPTGYIAREYLNERGVEAEVAKSFRIGFAPAAYGPIITYLKSKGFSENQIIAAGLAIRNDRGGVSERFRGRLIFPIADSQGRIRGFGGRVFGDAMPKYLNSPEGVMFNKSEILYGLFHAKRTIADAAKVIIVEGYMDVVSLHQSGVKNVVAPMGTAMGDTQLERLWKIVPEIIMCLDGDSAGQKAMQRIADIAISKIKPGFNLRFLTLPKGEDPDSLVRKIGAEGFNKMISSAVELAEFIWNSYSRDISSESPAAKTAVERELMAFVEKATDPILRKNIKTYFSEKLWALQKPRGKNAKNSDGSKSAIKKSDLAGVMASDGINILETAMMMLVEAHPEICQIPEVEEKLMGMEFISADLERTRVKLIGDIIDGAEHLNVKVKTHPTSALYIKKAIDTASAIEIFHAIYHEHSIEMEKQSRMASAASPDTESMLSEEGWNSFLDSATTT